MQHSVKQGGLVLWPFTLIAGLFLLFFLVWPNITSGLYGDGCEQYGVMAYDDGGGYCKCMSGYVFDTDYLGSKTCKLAELVCSDKYGIHSRYDILSNACECSYGYILANQYGRAQCVSRDSLCQDQLGYSARYNILSEACECGYGEVISDGQCKNGNSVCRSKHGLYSSYESSSNSCRCDYGYTFDDDNQCVEKQNNAYFRLLDVNTENKRAIIKSEYDSRKYLVDYGSGCYSFSIQRYVRNQIVINLGTDFEVDRWDRIVLQDDDEVCDIRSVERTYYDSFEEMDEESDDADFYYVPTVTNNQVVTSPPVAHASSQQTAKLNKDFEVSTSDVLSIEKKAKILTNASFRKCPSTECALIRYYAAGSEVLVTGEHKTQAWYQVREVTDVTGGGDITVGWIHKSLLEIETGENVIVETKEGLKEQSIEQESPEESSFFVRVWKSFLGWFR